MTNNILKYGVIQGFILLIGFHAAHLVFGTSPENYTASEITGYTVIILSCICIYFAVRRQKETNGGHLKFGQGLLTGLGVSAIGGFFFGLYNWVYVTWIHPSFTAEYMAYSEEKIRTSGLAQAEIDKQLAELEQYSDLMQSNAFMVVVMFFTVFLIGLLFSLVTAAIQKSDHA